MTLIEHSMNLYELLSLIISCVSLLVSIAGFVIIVLALRLSRKQLDDLRATSEGEMVKTMYEWWNSEEMYVAHNYTQRMKFKSWKDFRKRNPPGSRGWQKWMLTMNYFNTVGILVKRRALDEETADLMLKGLPSLWKTVEPLVVGYRNDFKSLHFAEEFEQFAKMKTST